MNDSNKWLSAGLLLIIFSSSGSISISTLLYGQNLPKTGSDSNYVLVHQGKYFDWYAYPSTWNTYKTNYSSQLDYPDKVYEELVQILGVDIIPDTPNKRLYILVDQKTGGGYANGTIREIGTGPGIAIAYDAWINIYAGKYYWSTDLIPHELTNVITGHIVDKWPRDWWADDRSPFPFAMKILVEQKMGFDDAASRSLNEADKLTQMFLGLRSEYGLDIYSKLLQSIKNDKWVKWVDASDSKLLSEYIAAYLSIAANHNLSKEINIVFNSTGINYQLDSGNVQNIWMVRQLLQQIPKDGLEWQTFRQGKYLESLNSTDYLAIIKQLNVENSELQDRLNQLVNYIYLMVATIIILIMLVLYPKIKKKSSK